MKRMTFAAILLALGSQAMAATCTSTTTWTNLGPPGSVNFGQTFGSAGSYTDCYTFSLSGPANSSGTTLENNILFDKLLVDVTLVSLFSGGITSGKTSASSIASDTTPDVFSFSNLTGGTYTLAVASTVYSSPGLYTLPVSYTGTMKTVASVASAVPEGDAYAMALAGLLGVGGVAATRRRRLG